MEHGIPAVGDSARGIEGNPVLRLLELQAIGNLQFLLSVSPHALRLCVNKTILAITIPSARLRGSHATGWQHGMRCGLLAQRRRGSEQYD
ncbi:hypothetical protein KDL44_15105 [bacterium]|nr:hypothetical protein [bacterium]